jgi:hypothetical protein
MLTFGWKLSAFSKYVISPKLKNIFKFGFDHTKSPEIYHKKQLGLKLFGNFLTLNFAFQKGQDEWNTLYYLFGFL